MPTIGSGGMISGHTSEAADTIGRIDKNPNPNCMILDHSESMATPQDQKYRMVDKAVRKSSRT